MSGAAIAFMLLTMGGVIALTVVCIGLWLRRPKSQPAPPAPSPPGGPPAEQQGP